MCPQSFTPYEPKAELTSSDGKEILLTPSLLVLETASEVRTLPIDSITDVQKTPVVDDDAAETFKRRFGKLLIGIFLSVLGLTMFGQTELQLQIGFFVIMSGAIFGFAWLFHTVNTLSEPEEADDGIWKVVVSTPSDSVQFQMDESDADSFIQNVYEQRLTARS